MLFNVTTSSRAYNETDKSRLESIGYTFKPFQSNVIHYNSRMFSKMLESVEIEINSLEELMIFQHKFGPIILDGNNIEIYDNYRE